MSLLSIVDLRFDYTLGQSVIENLSTSVSCGEGVVLAGPNGAGKSTLLKLCAGMLRPVSGRILVGGHPATSHDGRRCCWYMGPRPALFRLLTVREQLDFYAAAHGQQASRALELVRELVGEDVSDQLCAQLSTGQAQKVWFVASLACHAAPLILLDEPFSAMDIESLPRIAELLEEERRCGRALVLVTHTFQDLLPGSWTHADIRALSHPPHDDGADAGTDR